MELCSHHLLGHTWSLVRETAGAGESGGESQTWLGGGQELKCREQALRACDECFL